MDAYFEALINRASGDLEKTLRNSVEAASGSFTFPELKSNDKRYKLWQSLFDLIENTDNTSIKALGFSLARILSREKEGLNEMITESCMSVIKNHACTNGLEKPNDTVAIEALKALYNIIFNSNVAAAIVCKNGTVNGILDRLEDNKALLDDVKLFDMKIFFLITAQCPEMRNKVKEDMDGIQCLMDTLSCFIADTDCNQKTDKCIDILNDKEVDYCCEILKVLFNVTLPMTADEDLDAEETDICHKLVVMLRDLLMKPVENDRKQYELHNNVANLLTSMPNECLIGCLFNYDQRREENVTNQDFIAIDKLLKLLKAKFEKDIPVGQQYETLSPIITVFIKLASSHKLYRKYLRRHILPPLRDIYNRPEQGTTLRNYFCQLLTSPITQIRDLAAEFLFILCKENVGRMIKYTGYGNAAGMFANRGLLGGHTKGAANYSDSSDSETEEYSQNKHNINPVVGCYEEPHENPLDGLTDEQKEYEVMKLVNLMDNMTRRGLVKPCKIGEDGRPEPIEHVLQLQEGLSAQQIRQTKYCSDDSD